MARIPSVITNQGEEVRKLSEERQNKWISAISREDVADSILIGAWPSLWQTFYFRRNGKTVCGINTIQIGFQANLEAAAKRDERARDREMKRIAAEL